MHSADQISVGTVLCHPDGEAVVTDETRTSWKATRGGYEIKEEIDRVRALIAYKEQESK